jgi:hypothetical protein
VPKAQAFGLLPHPFSPLSLQHQPKGGTFLQKGGTIFKKGATF